MLLNEVLTIKFVLFRPFGSSTFWMFIFGGNSRAFRSSGMLLNGVFMEKKTRIFSYFRLVMCDVVRCE